MWPSTLKTKNDFFFAIWNIATADLTEVIQYSYKPEKKVPFYYISKSFLHSPAIKFRKWLPCWENGYSLDGVSYLISLLIHVTIDSEY